MFGSTNPRPPAEKVDKSEHVEVPRYQAGDGFGLYLVAWLSPRATLEESR